MGVPTAAFSELGYSVVNVDCLSNFSHIHEIGHNLGANHDKANANSVHPYNYAYRQCTGLRPFRTIMAYANDCLLAPRVNVFSNPNKMYDGRFQGTEEENNARVLNEAMATVVNFRESNTSRTPDDTPEIIPQPTFVTSIYPEALTNKRMVRKGCYSDHPADRVMDAGTKMPAVEGVTIGMTRENCMAYCFNHASNYNYFGVENGDECFCRHNVTSSQLDLVEIHSSRCGVGCAGGGAVSCGGDNAVEVFGIEYHGGT